MATAVAIPEIVSVIGSGALAAGATITSAITAGQGFSVRAEIIVENYSRFTLR